MSETGNVTANTAAPAATTEVSQSNVQGAKPSAKATVPQAKEAPKKYTVKIDGQEKVVTDADLIRDYQLKEASYKRMVEANKKSAQAEALLKEIEADPVKFLQSRNAQAREIAEKFLYEELKKEQLSPEQRKIMEYEEKLKSIEKEKAEAQKQEYDKQLQRDQELAAQKIDQELSEALAKSNLPKTPYTVKRIAHVMEEALNNGIDISVDDAIGYIQDNHLSDFKIMASTLSGEELMTILGKDLMSKIRKADVGRIKNPTPSKPSNPLKDSSPRHRQAKQTMGEWLEQLEKLKTK